MALIVDQQTNFKHFCKICKKGFGCGRALGGHMRAHGIGDDSGGHLNDDEEAASDWDDKLAGNVPPSNKRMYALRTNPNRLRTCRVCENCGKEFVSWKSFLEHGKCTSEDAESLVSSPPDSDADDDAAAAGRRGCGWSKRKRSFRAKVGNFNPHCPSSEEEVDLANCLMMLSNAAVDHHSMAVEPEESCASASKEEELQIRRNSNNNNNNFNFVAPISFRVPAENYINNNNNNNNIKAKGVVTKGGNNNLFECKACKKVFNSHQALGGHRASHKKVKGCFASRLDGSLAVAVAPAAAEDDVITHEEFFPTKSNSTLQLEYHGSNSTPLASTSKRKSKVHECSICHRIFSSGQALGGHKRCHWITSNAPAVAETAALAKFQEFQETMEQININSQRQQQRRPKGSTTFDNSGDNIIVNNQGLDLKLDLNLPAPTTVVPSFDVSTEIYLQPWMGSSSSKDQDQVDTINNRHHHHHDIIHDHNHRHKNDVVDNVINNEEYNNVNNNNTNSNGTSMQINLDDEADSKVKLAKLSELKDMNMSEGSSPWLQVGIGSTTDVAAGP